MRRHVSLQLTLGLGALFGLAHFGAERFLGPPLETSAIGSAHAHAIVGASEIASTWEKSRTGRRALIRALAGSPAFRESGGELLGPALESAAVQMGGGMAALVRSGGERIAGHGEGTERLVELKATADAHRGEVVVRFERIGGALHVVSAAPVMTADGRPWAALVFASELGEPLLRQWGRGLPQSSFVAIVEGDTVIASTVPPQLSAGLARSSNDEVAAGDARLRTARRSLEDDAGHQLSAVGVVAVASLASPEVMERARLLILTLGALALTLALLLVLIAPSGDVRELIEEFNQKSRDLPRVTDEQPLEAIELFPEPILEELPPRSRSGPSDALPPLVPPAPSFSSPGLSAPSLDGPPPKRDRPTSDTHLLLDAEQSLSHRPAPQPQMPPPSRSNPGITRPFAPQEAIPLPGTAPPPPRPAMAPSSSSPFDQIAAAAFSAPPPMAPPPATPDFGLSLEDDDLLMPKGVDLDRIAREAAKQGPPKYEPADLPGLRSPSFGGSSLSQSGLPPVAPRSSSRPTADLPGLKSNDPAARMFKEATPAPRRSSDPWTASGVGVYSTTPPISERLPVPDRVPSSPPVPLPSRSQSFSAPLPSISSSGAAAPSGPVAFDEEHYRVVYNDFVASKARLGEAVDNISYDGFRSKLRSSEEALINRHGCRAVRFQVLVKDNTVSLRPQLVR